MPGCVCYTTDGGYLFPTFVSAVQATQNRSGHDIDVLIFGFDIDADTERLFAKACERAGIYYIGKKGADIGHAPAMLARLFLADLLPEKYDQFLYVDGDTHITGSLVELLDQPLAAGRFRAAVDPMVFALDDHDRLGLAVNRHFKAIGLKQDEARHYFNTGVIQAEREGWAKIGAEAWQRFAAQPAATAFPDQDILNVVGLAQHEPMSLRWNFPIFLFNARVSAQVKPRIIHYMSKPKPWEGVFLPWDSAAFRVYDDIVMVYPELAPFWRRMPFPKRVRYTLQQHYKHLTETRDWAMSKRRERILAYENAFQV